MNAAEIAPRLFDLGEWRPRPGLPPSIAVLGFGCFVRERCGDLYEMRHVEFRGPNEHIAAWLRFSGSTVWHNDCEGRAMVLAIWADIHPTEVCPGVVSGSVVLQGPPIAIQAGRVYALDNLVYLHRTPQAAIDAPRFFARAQLVRRLP